MTRHQDQHIGYTIADQRDNGLREEGIHPVFVQRASYSIKASSIEKPLVFHCDLSGESIVSRANVLIKGSVEDCTIISQGHVTILGQCLRSSMYARGNASLRIVRDSDVFSEESIIILLECSSSNVQASGSLHAANAIVRGSTLSACDYISARKALTYNSVVCEFNVANIFLRRRKEYLFRERMLEAEKLLAIKKEVIATHKTALGLYSKDCTDNSSIVRTERELHDLAQYSENLHKQLTAYSAGHGLVETSSIEIGSAIDSGSIVRIRDFELKVESAMGPSYFVCGPRNEIVVGH